MLTLKPHFSPREPFGGFILHTRYIRNAFLASLHMKCLVRYLHHPFLNSTLPLKSLGNNTESILTFAFYQRNPTNFFLSNSMTTTRKAKTETNVSWIQRYQCGRKQYRERTSPHFNSLLQLSKRGIEIHPRHCSRRTLSQFQSHKIRRSANFM